MAGEAAERVTAMRPRTNSRRKNPKRHSPRYRVRTRNFQGYIEMSENGKEQASASGKALNAAADPCGQCLTRFGAWSSVLIKKNEQAASGGGTMRGTLQAVFGAMIVWIASSAFPAFAQSCNPGESRCFGTVEQRCEGGSAAQRPFGTETRGRWVSTGRACSAGGGGGGSSGGNTGGARQCSDGDTRCNADGKSEKCILGRWNPTYSGQRCDVIREETQTLCTPGDQKCGATGTVLVCEDANFRGKYVWRDTRRRCG